MICTQCGGTVDGRILHGRLHCHWCGAQHRLPDALAGDDRITPLAGTSDRCCPQCGPALSLGLMDEQRVEYCGDCHGVLIPSESFAAVVTQRRAGFRGPDANPTPLDPRELDRIVACPACSLRMETHPFYGPGPAVIDSCSRCRLIWLDRGEMHVIESAPGRRGAALIR